MSKQLLEIGDVVYRLDDNGIPYLRSAVTEVDERSAHTDDPLLWLEREIFSDGIRVVGSGHSHFTLETPELKLTWEKRHLVREMRAFDWNSMSAFELQGLWETLTGKEWEG